MPGTRSKIFLSYRASDTGASAALLGKSLDDRLKKGVTFFAPRKITAGQPFPDRLKEELQQTRVIVALIGETWLKARNKWGQRLLDLPDDWVRYEIAYGLKHDEVTVIPLLMNGTTLPSPTVVEQEDVLPKDLVPLATLNALRATSGQDFPSDVLDAIQAAYAMNADADANESPAHSIAIVHAEHADSEPKGESDSSDVVPHSLESVDSKKSASSLVSKIIEHLGASVFNYAVGSDKALDFTAQSELLSCDAAVLVVNEQALESTPFLAAASCLAWRHALGHALGHCAARAA